uniref:Uncharacterized protein n=1 Tax=Oryza barthii TaxID=65489 RepID=A0A0D3F8A9_9ORYZ
MDLPPQAWWQPDLTVTRSAVTTTGASKTSSWTTGDLLFSPVTRAADLAAWRLGAADLAAWRLGVTGSSCLEVPFWMCRPSCASKGFSLKLELARFIKSSTTLFFWLTEV